MNLPNFNSLVAAYNKALRKLFAGKTGAEIGAEWLNPSGSLFWNAEPENDPKFQAMAYRLAYRMSKLVAAENAKSWHSAAMKSTRAREIYRALQEEIKRTGLQPELQVIAARNAKLIRSVPSMIAQHLTQKAVTLQQEGKRDLEIIAELKRLAPKLTKSKMRLISRTEIARAGTDLDKLRAENLGLEWAVWSTSEDQRVRPSHRNLDGVLMNWNDPPQPESLIGEKSTLGRGFGGQFPNCRCSMLSLANLDEIKWPTRLYRNGAITRVTRAQFVRLLPAGQLIAA